MRERIHGWVTITHKPFPRKGLYEQLETWHLVSAQLASHARFTVMPRLARSRLENHAVCVWSCQWKVKLRLRPMFSGEPVTQVILLAKVINTHTRLQLTNVPQVFIVSTWSRRCCCERNHDDTKPSGSTRFRNTNTDPLSLPVSFLVQFFRFLLCNVMLKCDLCCWLVSVCQSVRLSCWCIVFRRLKISSN